MNLRQGLDRMLQHMERVQSPSAAHPTHTVLFRGRVMKCTVSTERRGEQLQVGGFVVQVQLTVIIRATEIDPNLDVSSIDIAADSAEVTSDDATKAPWPNSDIDLRSRSRTYRIVRVSHDGPESHYSLDLVDPYSP